VGTSWQKAGYGEKRQFITRLCSRPAVHALLNKGGPMSIFPFLSRLVPFVAFAALVIGCVSMAPPTAVPPTPATSGSGTPGASSVTGELRNVRYCEIIPSVVDGTTTTTYVYNTLGYNDCPPAQWVKINQAQVNQEYGSQSAQLNGPRHWVIDQLQASGATTTGETFTFGGIEMGLRATLVTTAGTPTVGNQFYAPNQVQRDTIYTFKAGEPIFILTAPDGGEFVMQSFAQIVDKTLTYEQLPDLASKLTLPTGWSYSTRTLTEDLTLNSNGLATVINDNLANSYQLNQ
jgi:hypothetical protein